MKKKLVGISVLLATLSATSVFAASNISIAQAKAIALKKVPGGTVTSIELDYENNRAIYDIDLVRNQYEYDLKLDAKTGSGISVRKELRDDASNSSNLNLISINQAKSIALKKVPGATIHKIDLDYEGGKAIYEIELYLNQYEYDLKLDARTGSGISIKKELRDGYTASKPQGTTFISKQQAKSAVLAKLPGATVTKIELDREDGVYELELRKGNVEYDAEVNARTGQVIFIKIDN